MAEQLISPPPAPELPIVDFLRVQLKNAETMLGKPAVPPGSLAMWSGVVRFRLNKIYGKDSPSLSSFPTAAIDLKIADPKAELTKRVEQVRRLIALLEAAPGATTSPLLGKKIFIGHGRSLVWLQLKDFLRDHARLPCDEFNIEPAAGMSTTERLETMLEQAAFAFIVMTAEEQHADGNTYARPNVIHEAGLFQGKLGTRRAIVLLESGCSEFSNITGLAQIRFPIGNLRAAFEDIRGVLGREKLI
jgi:predicted nucleotide-binding protein